ncbi:MAG: enoyl-ACP reductase [Chloroflexi bacterium]|nr:enoyl-ACP reductase [Chloroflexota bacterium]
MGLLEGKNALVFGIANKHSIAWGITQALHREGANIAVSYALEELERRVKPLVGELDIDFVERCNVLEDEEIDNLFAKVKDHMGTIDILVHSIAYAEREDLQGGYATTSRLGFRRAMDISVYSLVALTQRAIPLMPNGGSITAMTYYGSQKVLPHYNVMGVAKAALEASVRYLAADVGPQGIRVNAISAGPIKTLSASGIAGFRKLSKFAGEVAPLRDMVTQQDVGNAAVWLASDWGNMVTGETLYVDAGYNILGATILEEDLQ